MQINYSGAQCPNCGGYKVEATVVNNNPTTVGPGFLRLLRFGVWILLIVSLATVLSELQDIIGLPPRFGIPYWYPTQYGLVAGAIGLVALIFSLSRLRSINRSLAEWAALDPAVARDPLTTHYSCDLCGYRWTSKDKKSSSVGTPPHPEAARLGEIRLQEQARLMQAAAYEEQRRIRQQQDS